MMQLDFLSASVGMIKPIFHKFKLKGNKTCSYCDYRDVRMGEAL